jgi:hypothetical protein
MQPLGYQAFTTSVDPEALWRAGEQWRDDDSEISEAYLEYACTMADIRELPEAKTATPVQDDSVLDRIRFFTRPLDQEAE